MPFGAAGLSGYLIELEAIGELQREDLGGPLDRIDAAPEGLRLEWPELRQLSRELDQVFEVALAGCHGVSPFSAGLRRGADAQLPPGVEVVLERFDSSFWVLLTRSEELARAAQAHFAAAELYDLG